MNVTLRQLRVFLAVAKRGSFSRAAEQVGASQSAVSLAVQQLETELGVKLLDRTTRQVRLTGVGHSLVANASRLVGELDTMLKELRDIGERRRGRVALACVPSVARALMPRCVAYCATRWPDVSFTIEDIAAREVIAKVVRGDIEFGISSGEIAGSEFHVESLMEDPFLLVCRRDDVFAERRSVRWSMLADRRLVMLNNTSGSRQQIFETLASTGARSEIFLDLAQPTSVLAMVEAGLGVAVVPQLVSRHSGHPMLVTRKLVAPTFAARSCSSGGATDHCPRPRRRCGEPFGISSHPRTKVRTSPEQVETAPKLSFSHWSGERCSATRRMAGRVASPENAPDRRVSPQSHAP